MNVREQAIEQFRRQFIVPQGAEVSVSRETIDSSDVRDAHNRYVLPYDEGEKWTGEAVLFFVDCHPRANWAHDCTYVFIFADGRAYWWPRKWPPSETIEMGALDTETK